MVLHPACDTILVEVVPCITGKDRNFSIFKWCQTNTTLNTLCSFFAVVDGETCAITCKHRIKNLLFTSRLFSLLVVFLNVVKKHKRYDANEEHTAADQKYGWEAPTYHYYLEC